MSVAILSEVMEDNSQKLNLSFAQHLQKKFGEVKVPFPSQEVCSVYGQISEFTGEFQSDFDTKFIERGLEYVNENVNRNPDGSFLMSAFTIFKLRQIMDYCDIHFPLWLPKIYSAEEVRGAHNNTFYFDWATVYPEHIPRNMSNYIIMSLLEDSKKINSIKNHQVPIVKATVKDVEQTPPKDPVQLIGLNDDITRKIAAIQKVNIAIVTAKNIPIISDPVSEFNGVGYAVEHGIFVSKKYLSLIESACSRKLEFNISIEELSALLENKTCHYTGTPLIHYMHNKSNDASSLPDNYLTIDRVNNELGYISGNVVVCSKAVNILKNQMAEDEFQQAIEMKKVILQSNFSPEQLSAIGKLMSI